MRAEVARLTISATEAELQAFALVSGDLVAAANVRETRTSITSTPLAVEVSLA
jgi:hypothetical protein